jgi:hypothetical protein
MQGHSLLHEQALPPSSVRQFLVLASADRLDENTRNPEEDRKPKQLKFLLCFKG